MICHLCHQDKPLAKSHIIPKFVGKWLKETSATGYLRQATNPNLRLQDLPTEPLLCHDCEARFSLWEKQFAEQVFLPYQNEGKRKFVYEDWLLLFALSLSYRAAITELESFRIDASELASKIDEALSDWRASLLVNASPNRYDHHLFFLDVVANTKGISLPEGFHWYTLRGVDATIVSNSTEVFIYVKLPGMFFFSGVHPARPAGWHGTKIHQTGRILAAKQVITYGRLGEFLVDRAKQAIALSRNMSSKQEQKITDAIIKDREKTITSQTFRVQQIERFWKERQKSDEDD